MKPFDIFRVALMIAALVGVLGLIRSLNSDHVDSFFTTLGAEAGNETVNLCKTRIHAVKWPDGRKIEESKDGLKMKWMAYDPQPRELGYLQIEKWLSQNCRIKTQPKMEGGLSLDFETVFEVQFVDQSSLTVFATPGAGSAFRIDGREFSSPEFARAIAELKALATF